MTTLQFIFGFIVYLVIPAAVAGLCLGWGISRGLYGLPPSGKDFLKDLEPGVKKFYKDRYK